MSGSDRRRAKEQRRLAVLAVRSVRAFEQEIEQRALDLHVMAAERALSLRTRSGARMPASAEVAIRAASLERDLGAVADLLARVFVEQSAPPAAAGFSDDEVREHRVRVAAIVAGIRRDLGRESLVSEVSDTAAAALARATGLPFHRLIGNGYRVPPAA